MVVPIKIKLKLRSFLIILLCALIVLMPVVATAQEFDGFSDDPFASDIGEEDEFGEDFEDLNIDDLEFDDEGGFSTSESALEESSDEFGSEESLGGGEEYIDEDVLSDDTQQILESAIASRRDFLAEEKANLFANVAYGVGTGLLIGGWFALLASSTSRDTLRSIGLGIVLGGVMGSIIGGRSVITPSLPVPASNLPPEAFPEKSVVSTDDPTKIVLSYQWSF